MTIAILRPPKDYSVSVFPFLPRGYLKTSKSALALSTVHVLRAVCLRTFAVPPKWTEYSLINWKSSGQMWVGSGLSKYANGVPKAILWWSYESYKF